MSRYLGVDYGTRRVGLAISDGLGLTASPLDVVPRERAVARVRDLVDQEAVAVVVVGLPTGLGGGEGRSAEGARRLGEEIAAATGAAVVYLDERFTSKMAERSLQASGMRRRERRGMVDKVAAAIILQDFLDARRRSHGDSESMDVR